MPGPERAAFFDVDGTLVRTNIVHAFAFYAMNQGSILGTAWQTVRTVASIPMFIATDRLDRKLAAQVLAPGWVCDPAKARERLGFEARTPLAESIAAAAGWYRERGLLRT